MDPIPEQEHERLPDALERAFVRLRADRVPAEVDRSVLTQAAGHFAQRRRRRWTVTVGSSLAAAGVIAVAFLSFQRMNERVETQTARAEDVDGSGRVDILDAFALARALAHGDRPKPALDFTHDGRVDRADVDHVAQIAVRIKS
jgi:hypothetical protein